MSFIYKKQIHHTVKCFSFRFIGYWEHLMVNFEN